MKRQQIINRHLCFIGEIQNALSKDFTQFETRTRFDETVVVHFNLGESNAPIYHDWISLQVGTTICILYPGYLEISPGRILYVTTPSATMVFPVNLDALIEEFDRMQEA
jgi:hypothetical protein